MNGPLISVIIPTYNRAYCLERAIRSVLNQTYTNLELIIIDDSSDDHTESLVNSICDARIAYFKQSKQGACAARNHGIKLANGEYIAFQDSDDEWLPEKLETQMNFMQETQADLVSCAFVGESLFKEGETSRIPGEDHFSGRVKFTDLVCANFCSTQTLLLKKICFAEDMFDVNLPRLQEWELLMRLSEKYRMFFQNTVLVRAYIQKDSISKSQESHHQAMQQLYTMVTGKYCILSADSEFLKEQLSAASTARDMLQIEYNSLKNQLSAVEADRDHIMAQREQLRAQFEEISNATLWRISAPLRKVLDKIKIWIGWRNPQSLLRRGARCLKEHGLFYTIKRAVYKIFHRGKADVVCVPKTSEDELKAQRGTKFSREIKFSIIVPLYNTPENFLREMIESVQAQTYGNWELCMADGSDKEHGYVGQVCQELAQQDSRLCYKKLEKNMGISVNTNACLDMATGDYIALFDHDDLLDPSALYYMMVEICDHNADFVYTDELVFSGTIDNVIVPHFKPDYAPDTLRTNNYICHFSTFSRELLEKAGHFRPEYDGSQDFDIILRLTEKAAVVRHIPRILYYWRSHPASVASSLDAKPYALEAARNAVRSHLERVGLKGTVMDSFGLSTYRVKYEIQGEPLVSILIANRNGTEKLEKCIASIQQKSTYRNFEIVVMDNHSTDKSALAYYERLRKEPNARVMILHQPVGNSTIMNFAAKQAKGDMLLFLHTAAEVISPDWIQEMLMFAQRPDVGAVGAKLYYPNDTIHHAGLILGMGSSKTYGHAFHRISRDNLGYFACASYVQNLSIVSDCCMMVRKSVWEEVCGMDETYHEAYGDADFCLRLREEGYLNVWTPYAELYYYQSKQKLVEESQEYAADAEHFRSCWAKQLAAGDAYYNPNLPLERTDYSFSV